MIGIANSASRSSLLQGLQRFGQCVRLRFAEQEVMLGHDDVPLNLESVTVPHSLQTWLEGSAACFCCEESRAVVAAECDEMTLSAVAEACKFPWHKDNSAC